MRDRRAASYLGMLFSHESKTTPAMGGLCFMEEDLTWFRHDRAIQQGF